MTGTVELPQTQRTGPDYFDLRDALARLAQGEPLRFPPLEIVRARIEGREVTFCCNMQRDPVQKNHRAGRFFEAEELALLRDVLPKGLRMLDVGANVGNHTLFFALVAGAARIVPVEPNPLALAPLVANIVLNGVQDVVEMGALGIGLSNASEGGYGMKRHDRNLGATRMRAGRGDLQVHAGDDLFEDESFDFIKIDVEGMEMKVLAGLEKTIARCRPLIFVEVDDENAEAFGVWLAEAGYRTRHQMRHYGVNENYLIEPVPENER